MSHLPQYPKSGAFAYVSTPAATTTTVAGDWYRLAGTFTNEILEDFNITSDKLTYIGEETQLFQIIVMATFQSNTVNTTVTLGLFKNGVLEENSQMATKVVQTTDTKALALVDAVSLAKDDNIEIKIKSDKAGAEVTATHVTTSAQKFY